MPNLILENVPQELYDDLRQAAELQQRSVADEALARLRWVQRRRLPDEPLQTGEISAPCTIPLPGPGKPVLAKREPLDFLILRGLSRSQNKPRTKRQPLRKF